MGFLYFFSLNAGGQTTQPIFTQNGLINVALRKDVPFVVKIATFLLLTPDPENQAHMANFWT